MYNRWDIQHTIDDCNSTWNFYKLGIWDLPSRDDKDYKRLPLLEELQYTFARMLLDEAHNKFKSISFISVNIMLYYEAFRLYYENKDFPIGNNKTPNTHIFSLQMYPFLGPVEFFIDKDWNLNLATCWYYAWQKILKDVEIESTKCSNSGYLNGLYYDLPCFVSTFEVGLPNNSYKIFHSIVPFYSLGGILRNMLTKEENNNTYLELYDQVLDKMKNTKVNLHKKIDHSYITLEKSLTLSQGETLIFDEDSYVTLYINGNEIHTNILDCVKT